MPIYYRDTVEGWHKVSRLTSVKRPLLSNSIIYLIGLIWTLGTNVCTNVPHQACPPVIGFGWPMGTRL